MAEKRKDKRGRILQKGESQRKDGRYQYRYTDYIGRRHVVYADDLQQLREKEDQIIKATLNGNLMVTLNTETVKDLLLKYRSLQTKITERTAYRYDGLTRKILNEPFSRSKIADVRISDAKRWLVDMTRRKVARTAIYGMYRLTRAAFDMAVEDETLLVNPLRFRYSDIIDTKKPKKKPLTRDEQARLLEFIKNSKVYSRYYDMTVIMLNTGIRVSELAGLTVKDVDFGRRILRIDHQLVETETKGASIVPPKSESGVRDIPMNDAVCEAFRHAIKKRNESGFDCIIGNKSGFIFLTEKGKTYFGKHIAQKYRGLRNKYNQLHPDTPIFVTPHILRHTFATNKVAEKMDIKSLQYVMGHSNSSLTLDVYAHADFEQIVKEMNRTSQIA